jgi:tetratricopeptide (TPR) repeat protein
MSADHAARNPIEAATNAELAQRLFKQGQDNGHYQPNRPSLLSLRKAVKHFRKGEWRDAAIAAAEAADHDARAGMAFHLLGLALENLGQRHKAFEMFERALALNPHDTDLYLNIGVAAQNLQLHDGAMKAYRAYIDLNPGCHKGYNNLAGVLRDMGRFEDAIELVRNAIVLMPEQAMLWNTLGSILGEQCDFEKAILFYREACRLDPKFSRGYHNLGHALMHPGPLNDALANLDLAVRYCQPGADADLAETRHARGLCLAAMGRLAEAWPEYEQRLNPRCSQTAFFAVDAPAWDGEDVTGKTLLFVGEQGLGDEIMLSSLVPDLLRRVGPDGKLMIACDYRLVPLLRRSFPEAHVDLQTHAKHNGAPVHIVGWARGEMKADYYTPMGVPLKFLRNSVSDFPAERAYLKPDPDRVRFWQDRLAALGPGPHIGISWRSMLMTTQRRKFYSALEIWKPLLEMTGAKFINLQYGDCREEIAQAQERLGVTIHNFEDLDLKNNLDDNAALCAALDLVVSAPTAAAALAAATGTETWFLTAGRVWPQLGTDHYPWYQNTRVLTPERFGDWETLMTMVAGELKSRLEGATA